MGCGCKGKKTTTNKTATSTISDKEAQEKRMRLIREKLIRITNQKK